MIIEDLIEEDSNIPDVNKEVSVTSQEDVEATAKTQATASSDVTTMDGNLPRETTLELEKTDVMMYLMIIEVVLLVIIAVKLDE